MMKNYEKPIMEVVSFQEEEKLMSDLDNNELSLNGIIGYSLRSNSQTV